MKLLLFAVVLPYLLAAPNLDSLRSDVKDGTKPVEELFQLFIIVFEKRYTAIEKDRKLSVFKDNIEFIRKHNQLYDSKATTYYLGVNQFSDLTDEELLAMYTTDKDFVLDAQNDNIPTFLALSDMSLPASVNWTEQGYVTPVKNQGNCGSCWGFSATGALEGQHFKTNGRLEPLSEQQLIDCSTDWGNQGSNGGDPLYAFKYIKDVGGIEGEETYPYTAEDGACRFNKTNVVTTVTGHKEIPRGDEHSLQEAVAHIGPISVSIDSTGLNRYGGDVYYNPNCSSTHLTHSVLVVGYGSLDSDDYWLVKNSWGTSWGMQGYIRMARNMKNNCGIATEAVYPTVGHTSHSKTGDTSHSNTINANFIIIFCFITLTRLVFK